MILVLITLLVVCCIALLAGIIMMVVADIRKFFAPTPKQSDEPSGFDRPNGMKVLEKHSHGHYTVVDTKSGKVYEMQKTDSSVNDVAEHEWTWTQK